MILTNERICELSNYLRREEKSAATQEKYLRDVQAFCAYADGNELTKELVVAWKKHLIDRGYAVRSVNSMLASINSLLDFLGLSNCKAKNIRMQQQTYCAEDKELTKAEYTYYYKLGNDYYQVNSRYGSYPDNNTTVTLSGECGHTNLHTEHNSSCDMKKNMKKKALLTMSVALLLFVAVCTTLAYIFTKTEPVENTFNPSKVSCAVVENGSATENTDSIVETGKTKKNVQIKNTGDTDAYIRVAVVINWMSEDGTKVWATKPVEGTDYSINWAFDDTENPTAWDPGSDGYYYYKNSVVPNGGVTEILITEAKVLKEAPQEGYDLSIEIVASAIQAKPTSVVTSQWGVTVANDGTISK